jgi:hypothetical protein
MSYKKGSSGFISTIIFIIFVIFFIIIALIFGFFKRTLPPRSSISSTVLIADKTMVSHFQNVLAPNYSLTNMFFSLYNSETNTTVVYHTNSQRKFEFPNSKSIIASTDNGDVIVLDKKSGEGQVIDAKTLSIRAYDKEKDLSTRPLIGIDGRYSRVDDVYSFDSLDQLGDYRFEVWLEKEELVNPWPAYPQLVPDKDYNETGSEDYHMLLNSNTTLERKPDCLEHKGWQCVEYRDKFTFITNSREETFVRNNAVFVGLDATNVYFVTDKGLESVQILE